MDDRLPATQFMAAGSLPDIQRNNNIQGPHNKCNGYLVSLPASSSPHWRWTRTICGERRELPGECGRELPDVCGRELPDVCERELSDVCGRELPDVCVGEEGITCISVNQTALKSHAHVFKY